LCGKVSLLEMAEVIRRATLFVGVESGPAHIANAVGTHGIVMIGPYRGFGQYVPYSGDYGTGANATMLREPTGLSNLATERVVAAIDDFLAGAALRRVRSTKATHDTRRRQDPGVRRQGRQRMTARPRR